MPAPGLAFHRPLSPDIESPRTSTTSLDNASNTIDDLTLALANFSRVPSPEPPSTLACCCGRESCENLKAWQAAKSRLESRLILSAEVGQALLQRHESYLRRHQASAHSRRSTVQQADSEEDTQDELASRVTELMKENVALEKRLSRALVNNEVTEVSNKTILQELQDAKMTISRLSAHHARSVGWDTRLSAAIQERDDMQQERDYESQRARLAESRFAALKDKTAKVQAEVRRLQDELQARRLQRLESSESLIREARSRLEAFHQTIDTSPNDSAEFTKVLESLVEDNEVLKRDNAELQMMLKESREEQQALHRELEEQRANVPPHSRAGTPVTPSFRQHHYTGSVPSTSSMGSHRRASSLERRPRRFDLLTPESSTRPLSPTDSRYITSPYQIEFSHSDEGPSSPGKTRTHRPLFLLTRSRGVQTETWPAGLLSPSPVPSSTSPIDPRSESSSFSESTASTIAILLERIGSLLNRMTQADALTLTNRLKRQHLRGADVGHLSRSTVSSILSDLSTLRNQFRAVLEDDKAVATCTRKDLRSLFKVFKDVFNEMGEMRVTLNEVILDPGVAPKVSEMALNPSKENGLVKEGAANGTVGGWIGPISKLFGAPSASGKTVESVNPSLGRSSSTRSKPQRFVPKLGPALAASATTVNVEFSGTGVGRSVTSTSSAYSSSAAADQAQINPVVVAPVPTRAAASDVMNIFAGAPRSQTPESWVILSKTPRRMQSSLRPADMSRTNPNRLSRNVDAIVDLENNRSPGQRDDASEEVDMLGPLMQRTLRRRGLSDSSIHSTFMEHRTEELEASPDQQQPQDGSETAWPDRGSVLQALSRRVQSFRLGTSSNAVANAGTTDTPPPASSKPTRGSNSFISDLSTLDAMAASEPFLVGSPRDETSLLSRTRRPQDPYYY